MNKLLIVLVLAILFAQTYAKTFETKNECEERCRRTLETCQRNCRNSACRQRCQSNFEACRRNCGGAEPTTQPGGRCYERCDRARGSCERNCRNSTCREGCARTHQRCIAACDGGDSTKKTTEEPKCGEKVKEVRKKFRELEREEKREFIQKVRAKLSEKYPDVEERQVNFFVRPLFSRAEPKRVCGLYRRIFLGDAKEEPGCDERVSSIRKKFREVPVTERREFVNNLREKLSEKYPDVKERQVRYFLRALFSRAPATRVCALYKRIFLGDAKKEDECDEKVTEIRKKFRELETREERREFLGKARAKLAEKYPDVEERQVNFFLRALFSRAPTTRVCALYRRIFLGDAKHTDEEPTCDEKVAKVRKAFRALETREERREFLQKANTKLTEKYPDVEERQVRYFLRALFSRALATRVCALYRRIFLGDAKNDGECTEKVDALKAKFAELEREERREFIGKVRAKLSEKYPDVEERQVNFFLRALFSRASIQRVCALYRRIFLGDDQEVDVTAEEEKTVVKEDDKPKCPEIVKKVRGKFRELETKEEKKEFVKKVFKRLSEKYPDVERRAVFRFIKALLSRQVKPKAVCAMRRRIFPKPEVKVSTESIIDEVEAETN